MHEPVEALREVVMSRREFRRWRWKDGWMFEREPDGSVRIITCQPTREYPLHTIAHETVIPPEEWARILAYLSGAGQDDLSIQAAKRFHATGR